MEADRKRGIKNIIEELFKTLHLDDDGSPDPDNDIRDLGNSFRRPMYEPIIIN